MTQSNLSPVIDAYGKLVAQIKELEKRKETFQQDYFRTLEEGTYEGEAYILKINDTTGETPDAAYAKEIKAATEAFKATKSTSTSAPMSARSRSGPTPPPTGRRSRMWRGRGRGTEPAGSRFGRSEPVHIHFRYQRDWPGREEIVFDLLPKIFLRIGDVPGRGFLGGHGMKSASNNAHGFIPFRAIFLGLVRFVPLYRTPHPSIRVKIQKNEKHNTKPYKTSYIYLYIYDSITLFMDRFSHKTVRFNSYITIQNLPPPRFNPVTKPG